MYVLYILYSIVILISLESSRDEDICLGEFVTFTCTGYGVLYLKWNLTNHSGSHRSKSFAANGVIGETESLKGFIANLTGIDTNGARKGNITLKLSALVQLEMNKTTIECSTLTSNGKISKQTALIVEGKVYDPRIIIIINTLLFRLQCSTFKFEL